MGSNISPIGTTTRLFLVVIALNVAFGLSALFASGRDVWGLLHAVGSYPTLLNTAALAFNLWGLVASLIFAAVVINPFAWLNGRRLIVGSMAFAIMLGAMGGGVLSQATLALIGLATPAPIITGGTISAGWMAVFVVALFLLAPLVQLFLGATGIIALSITISMILGVFIGIPTLLFREILAFDHELRVYRYEAQGLAAYIVRFMYWLRNQPLPELPPDESRGARFATQPEAVARHNVDVKNPARMAFGHWPNYKGKPVYLHTDKHVLVMASTRSGKGVSLIIPHLLRYGGSAFVLDPKGENAKATIRRRETINGSVHVLDPFGLTGLETARFNPLSRFTLSNAEAESKALAAALFVVKNGEQDHWSSSGQQLLAALILYVALSPDIPDEMRDLPTVRRLLLGNLRPTLQAMSEMDEADGLLRDLAMSFLETPEKEFGSIVSTAQRQTEILDNPHIVACLSEDGPGEEVDFADWRRGTMTVYLCLSAPKFPVFNRWLRLVLTSALDEMTDTLDPPALPVCFMLDELATLGHLQAVENAVGLAAGYGIQLVCVFQDVAQMRDLYKGRWASFIGNAGVRALFNLDDYDTAKYWSDFVGGTLVETHGRQENVYGLSSGQNVGEAMRPLLPPDKLMMEFSSGKMLVLAQGLRPVVTDRVAYFDDTSLKGLWDDPRQQPTPVQKQPEKAGMLVFERGP